MAYRDKELEERIKKLEARCDDLEMWVQTLKKADEMTVATLEKIFGKK